MTDTPTEEKLYGAVYMVRNLCVGDEEQIRISEGAYLNELPDPLRDACRFLCEKGDYDGAIMIYVRWNLRDVTVDALTATTKEVWNDLSEGVDAEDRDPNEMLEWLEFIYSFAVGRPRLPSGASVVGRQ